MATVGHVLVCPLVFRYSSEVLTCTSIGLKSNKVHGAVWSSSGYFKSQVLCLRNWVAMTCLTRSDSVTRLEGGIPGTQTGQDLPSNVLVPESWISVYLVPVHNVPVYHCYDVVLYFVLFLFLFFLFCCCCCCCCCCVCVAVLLLFLLMGINQSILSSRYCVL